MDAKLNARLEKEFFKAVAVKREGEPLKFTPEEIKASNEWCFKNHGEPGKMETMVLKERALAATKPDLFLN
ncbi:MAG: hypothetical protein LBI14_00950 [Treponema sp.]|nr:hypothetical protein [Treponema sp.]